MTDSIRRRIVKNADQAVSTNCIKFDDRGKSGEFDFFCGGRPFGKEARRLRFPQHTVRIREVSGPIQGILSFFTTFTRRNRVSCILALLLLAFGVIGPSGTPLSATERDSAQPKGIYSYEELWNGMVWETDYEKARERAKSSSRNLLIYFAADSDSPRLRNETEEKYVSFGSGKVRQLSYTMPSMQKPIPIAQACRKFEEEVLYDMSVMDELGQYVLLKLSIDAKTDVDGKQTPILSLPQYEEMQGLPGLVVVDFEHRDEPYFESPVGILPFIRAKVPTVEQTFTFLTLPQGSLTQRTLIYAVRTHPERPLSAMGDPEPVLMNEARGHSAYQAKVRVLGHQNFGARTARIAGALNCGGASEVCAQSWSGEGLYEAAIGCVRSWRGSSGHWKGVRAANRLYGYDMIRGENGTWYATGLFVK